ncbi:MAG: trypsin-like peptidase domain-containing protein [Flavobacteriales bacterium]|nr:trypsin-like peptidase domain-containing protein [Flavobacteriales bacterium]
MRSLYQSLFLTATLLTLDATAQLSFGGHPYGMDRSNDLPVAPITVMAEVDATSLMAEDEERRIAGIKGPYRFGFNHATDIGLDNAGIWHSMPNGDRIWRATVQCPGAFSINMEFHDYVIPEGAQVFVYNEMGHMLGGFEANSNPGQTQMGVDLLPGDQVTVEYVEPAEVAGMGRLRIGQVTHGYRDVMGMTKGLNESGSCNNNVICPEGDDWRDQIRSVAMLVTGGDGFCTGTLLNNCNNDGTPYFLTANHCMVGASTNVVFRFNWNSPQCTPTVNGPMNQSVVGYSLLHNSTGSDVALLRLNTTPPASFNVFYSGWDKSSAASTGGATCIHHPSGDIKKISFENQNVVSSSFGGAQCWRVNDWDDGTTEPGSSGSGLWNADKRIIGQLYGGSAACGNDFPDYFGKFSVSFSALQQWLGDCGNAIDGYPLSTSSISEVINGADLEAWPNPTTGLVNMVLPNGHQGVWTAMTYDAVGQLVSTDLVPGGTERFDLDLGGQPNGLYLIEVRSGDVRLQQRVMVAR